MVRILVGGARTLTPRFAALASHYLLEACVCRPGESHDKGGVESRGKAIRQQARADSGWPDTRRHQCDLAGAEREQQRRPLASAAVKAGSLT